MQQPKRILLIDEDFDHLLICSLFLQREGYEVKAVAGCEKMEDLIEVVGSFRPDLIFMDHDMRGICGMDLTRMLKSLEEFSGIPIIYFTDRSDIVKLAKEAGADGYFRKPFDTNGLIAFTRRYLDR
jgi:DNA-binding response OmpR family regulator